jgi:hypothetical protein
MCQRLEVVPTAALGTAANVPEAKLYRRLDLGAGVEAACAAGPDALPSAPRHIPVVLIDIFCMY